MKHTLVDAFSGAGGLSLGLKQAGYEPLLSFDDDPKSIETQMMNPEYFDHHLACASVDAMLGGGALKEAGLDRGELSLLAGGPPCQGFSIQRIGHDEDTRNNLVLEFMALVEEMMPHRFLMENVLGIVGRRGRALLKHAVGLAAEAGYWVHHQVVDAQDYGVPQRRRRVFVVGERSDVGLASFMFPNPTTPLGSRKTVRETIGHLPPPPADGSEHPRIRHHRKDKLSEMNMKRLLALKPGQGRQHLPEELLADCHRRDSSIIGHRNVYGRMAWDNVAPTITARFDSFTRGLFGHPEQTRSISLREGALLQTFPADFVFSGNKVDVARQIGNAVPPALAKAMGEQILACGESETSLRPA